MPRITFDIVNHLFIVVCGCGSMTNLSRSLAIMGYVVVSEAVCVSYGLPLMYITSLLGFVGGVPMINRSRALAIFCGMYCVPVICEAVGVSSVASSDV